MGNIEIFKKEIKEQVKNKLTNQNFDLKLEKKKLIIYQDGKKIGTIDLSEKDKSFLEYLKNNINNLKQEIKNELKSVKVEVFERLSDIQLIDLYRSLKSEKKDTETLTDEAIEKVYISRLNASLPAKIDHYINLLKKYEGKQDYLLLNTKIALMLSATNEEQFKKVLDGLFNGNVEDYKTALLEAVGIDKKFLYNYLEYRYSEGHTFILKKGDEVLKISDKIIQCNNISHGYCKKLNSLVFAILNTYNNGNFLYVKNFNFIANKLVSLFDDKSFTKGIDELDVRLANLADNIGNMDLFRYYMKRQGVLGAFNTLVDIKFKDFEYKDSIKPLVLIGGFLFTVYYTFKKLGFWKGLGALFLGGLGLSIGGTLLGDYLKKEFGKDFAPDKWKEVAEKNPEILNGIEFLKVFAGSFTIGNILSFVNKNKGEVDVDNFLSALKEKNSYYYNALVKLPKAQINYLIKCGLVGLGFANWRADGSGKIVLIDGKISQVDKNQKIYDYIKGFYNNDENKQKVLSILPSAQAATIDNNKGSNLQKPKQETKLDTTKSQDESSIEKFENDTELNYVLTISKDIVSYSHDRPEMVRSRDRKEVIINKKEFANFLEQIGQKNSLEALPVWEQKLYLLNFYISIWSEKVQAILQEDGNGALFWIQHGNRDEFIRKYEQIIEYINKQLNKANDKNIDDKNINDIINSIIDKTVELQREHGFLNKTILDNIYSVKSIILAHNSQKYIYKNLNKIIESLREGYFTDGASELLPFYMQELLLNDTKFNKLDLIQKLKTDILPTLQAELYNLDNISKWGLIDSEGNFYGYDAEKLFIYIKDILNSNQVLKNYFDEKELTELASELSKQIFESGSAIYKYISEREKEIEQQFDKFCEEGGLSNEECKTKKEEFLQMYKKYTYISYMFIYLKSAIIGKIIAKIDEDKISDPAIKEFIEKYKDIVGIGWFNPSDTNKLILIDVASTIALSLIPFGISIAAGRLVLGAARWGANVSKLSYLANLPKVGRGIAFVGRSSALGLGNMFGYEFGDRLLYDWDNLGKRWFKNGWEFFKEWAKWTGYNMVFSFSNPVIGLINKLKIKPNDKVLLKISNGTLKVIKYPAIGAVDATGMMAVDLGTEFGFDKLGLVEGEYEMNAETFAQMMMFSMLMRGIGSSDKFSKLFRVKYKDKDGKEITIWPKFEGTSPDNLIKSTENIGSKLKGISRKGKKQRQNQINTFKSGKNDIESLKNDLKIKFQEKQKLEQQIEDLDKKIKLFEDKQKLVDEINKLLDKNPEAILLSKEKINLFGLSNHRLKKEVKDKLEELVKKIDELDKLKSTTINIPNKNIKIQTLESEIKNLKNDIIGKIGIIKSTIDNKISALETKRKNLESKINNVQKEIDNINLSINQTIKDTLIKDLEFKKEIKVKFTHKVGDKTIEKTLIFNQAKEFELEGEKYWIVKGKNSNNIYVLKPEIKGNQIVVKKGNIYKLDEFVKSKTSKLEKYISEELDRLLNAPTFTQKLKEKIKNIPGLTVDKVKENLIKLKNGEIDKQTFMKNVGCRLIFGATCDRVPNWNSKFKAFIKTSLVNTGLVLSSEIISGKLGDDLLTVSNLMEIGMWNVVESFSNKLVVFAILSLLVGKDFIFDSDENINFK